LSKIQTEIALSSTEAEYIALSQCCRAYLLTRRRIKDILSCGLFPNSLKHEHIISTHSITTGKFESSGKIIKYAYIWTMIHYKKDQELNTFQ
jgi:hypothetical protein